MARADRKPPVRERLVNTMPLMPWWTLEGLAERVGANPATTRKVLQKLVREGIVSTRKGRRTGNEYEFHMAAPAKCAICGAEPTIRKNIYMYCAECGSEDDSAE